MVAGKGRPGEEGRPVEGGKAPGAGVQGLYDLGGAQREKVLSAEPRGSESLLRRGGFGGWRSGVPGGPRCTGTGEKTSSAGREHPRFGPQPSACHPALPSASWGSLAPPRAPPGLGDGAGVGTGSERVGRSGCGPRSDYFLLH